MKQQENEESYLMLNFTVSLHGYTVHQ